MPSLSFLSMVISKDPVIRKRVFCSSNPAAAFGHMDEELICLFCTNLFTDPVLLPCGHNLCLRCAEICYKYDSETSNQIVKWLGHSPEQSSKHRVDCPVCGFEFHLPNTGVHGMTRNRVIEKLIERLKMPTESQEPGSFHCEFCEMKTQATVMCENCDYWYCDKCFQTMHPAKGPLACHTKIEPRAKTKNVDQNADVNVAKCEVHLLEEARDFCINCKDIICKLCRDQDHKGHEFLPLSEHYDNEKGKIRNSLKYLQQACSSTQDLCDDYERLFACVKTAASETEAHIKRQIDRLIHLLEKKKEEFLEHVNEEYLKTTAEISNCYELCKDSRAKADSFCQFVLNFLEEQEFTSYIKASQPVLLRLTRTTEQLNGAAKPDWSVVSIFSKMTTDIAFQQKVIDKLDWLKVPGPATFKDNECYARNGSVFLKWNPPDSLVENYMLEVKSDEKPGYVCVYKGPECQYTINDIKYGCRITARIKAVNSAGTGNVSEELNVLMPKGFHLRFSPEYSDAGVSLSTDLKSVKTTLYKQLTAVSDSVLSSCVHFWRAHVVKLPAKANLSSVEIGIQRDDRENREGGQWQDENTRFYGVEILPDPSKESNNTINKIQLRKTKTEIKDMMISFVLNFDTKTLNIYLDGLLITQDASKNSTFENIEGSFVPVITMKGKGICVDFLSELPLPNKVPPPPQPCFEKCFASNTRICIAWNALDLKAQSDAYIVEVKYSNMLDSRSDFHKFHDVYRGCKTYFEMDTFKYSLKVKARIRAVNIFGVGDPSEEVILETSKGLTFNMMKSSTDLIQTLSDGNIICQPGHDRSCLVADTEICIGKHCWGFIAEQFNPGANYVAFGLSKMVCSLKSIDQVPDAYAVLLHCNNKRSDSEVVSSERIIAKSVQKARDSQVRLYLDFDSEILNIYVNSILLQRGHSLTNVSGTFSGIKSGVRPSIWIRGEHIKVKALSGLEVPTVPGQPRITTVTSRIKNTTLTLEWSIADASDCIDYFIVEMFNVHNHTSSNEPLQFQEVYRGSETTFKREYLPYDNEVTCRVSAVNFMGKSKASAVFSGMTAKGFNFKLDKRSAHCDLQIHQKCVSLSSPVYATVLGDVPLPSGRHYWEICIDQFDGQGETAVVGIGIASKDFQDPVLGEDSYSYALQIHQHTKIVCNDTRNKIQMKQSKSEAESMIVGIHVDTNEKWMDAYFHGDLVLGRRNEQRSFLIRKGTFYPALSLYGTNVKLTVRAAVDFAERFVNE